MMQSPAPNYVHVSNETDSPLDKQATERLLAMVWTGAYYKCPRCAYQTEDTTFIVNHLVEEINASLSGLEKMGGGAKAPA